jgi:hypothetical protein
MRIIVKQLCTLRRRRPPEHDRVRANPAHVPPSRVILGMVQSFVLMVIQLVATTARIVKLTWIGRLRTPQLTLEWR